MGVSLVRQVYYWKPCQVLGGLRRRRVQSVKFVVNEARGACWVFLVCLYRRKLCVFQNRLARLII